MSKLPKGLKNIDASKINWPKEITHTLEVTGWSKAELAAVLGLYVQAREPGQGGNVSPQIYAWLRGRNRPKLFLLYALRYLQAHYGQAKPAATKPPRKPKE